MNVSKFWMGWVLSAIVCIGAAPRAHAQLSPIVITVNVVGDTDRDRAKPPKSGGVIPKEQVTQERQLEINLSNRSVNSYANLIVQYCLFGVDVDTKNTEPLRVGKRERINIPSMGLVPITSESVSTSFTRQYTKKSGGKTVTVPAAGVKFHGYGVQVLQGATVLAERYEPVELKAKMNAVDFDEELAPKKSKKRKSHNP